MTTLARQVPRALHPGAWWLWAIGLGTAASRTTNPLLLLVILAVAGHVVTARRSDAPWSRSFAIFLKLGVAVIAIRVVAQTLFGSATPGTVLLDLPQIGLPDWAAGVTLGGPITDAAVAAALVDGLRLATMLACIGAANALANPKRLLASLPAALYEVGVAVVVALSFAPSMATSVQRIRAARRLRGRPSRGIRGLASTAMPVLEDALERSLALAAAMDSRGYGRRAAVPASTRRLTGVLTLTGLAGTTVGIYGLLDGTGPPTLGVPLLLFGLAVAAGGLALGGRGAVRTRYRPDPWRAPEWTVTIVGLIAATSSIVGGVLDPAALLPTPLPIADLPVPLLPLVGVVACILPSWATPPPPDLVGPARADRDTTDTDHPADRAQAPA